MYYLYTHWIMHKKGNWFNNTLYYNLKRKVFQVFINFLKKPKKTQYLRGFFLKILGGFFKKNPVGFIMGFLIVPTLIGNSVDTHFLLWSFGNLMSFCIRTFTMSPTSENWLISRDRRRANMIYSSVLKYLPISLIN